MMIGISLLLLLLLLLLGHCHISANGFSLHVNNQASLPSRRRHSVDRKNTALRNQYDDWRSDSIVLEPQALEEETVQACLDELVQSDYGQTMFGCHERAASIGITGEIGLVEVCGPEVTLQLDGQFWHRRETVLGRAAVWLNVCMPEIAQVVVADPDELLDFDDVIDEISGEILFRTDKRSPDFNGDRETMEYQGLDPDVRGPFPPNTFGSGSSLITPI